MTSLIAWEISTDVLETLLGLTGGTGNLNGVLGELTGSIASLTSRIADIEQLLHRLAGTANNAVTSLCS